MLAERGLFAGHLPLLRQVAHQSLQQASQVFIFEPVLLQNAHLAIAGSWELLRAERAQGFYCFFSIWASQQRQRRAARRQRDVHAVPTLAFHPVARRGNMVAEDCRRSAMRAAVLTVVLTVLAAVAFAVQPAPGQQKGRAPYQI